MSRKVNIKRPLDQTVMLVIEFVIVIITLILVTSTFLLVLLLSKRSPVNEMKILSVAFFFSTLTALFVLPSTILYTTDTVHPLGILFDKIDVVLAHLAITSFCYAIMIPSFKASYKWILAITLLTAINTASAVFNFLSMTDEVSGDYIRVVYDPMGLFLVALSVLLFIIVIAVRIMLVTRVLRKLKIPFSSISSLSIFLVFSTLIFGTLLLTRFFPAAIPGYTWFIPASLTLMFFPYALLKNRAFFFITSASLDAIILTEQKTGLVMYSKVFKEKETTPEALIGSIFNALNMSLKESIKSLSGLEHVAFGDKVVLLAPGQWITTLMIVSEKNFITEGVSRHITREFEKQYEETLVMMRSSPVKKKVFHEFEEVITEIRNYIPL